MVISHYKDRNGTVWFVKFQVHSYLASVQRGYGGRFHNSLKRGESGVKHQFGSAVIKGRTCVKDKHAHILHHFLMRIVQLLVHVHEICFGNTFSSAELPKIQSQRHLHRTFDDLFRRVYDSLAHTSFQGHKTQEEKPCHMPKISHFNPKCCFAAQHAIRLCKYLPQGSIREYCPRKT